MTDYNNKNFILAIVLSMAIIFGWQYFYAGPIAEKAKKQTELAQTAAPAAVAQPAAVPREQVLTSAPPRQD